MRNTTRIFFLILSTTLLLTVARTSIAQPTVNRAQDPQGDTKLRPGNDPRPDPSLKSDQEWPCCAVTTELLAIKSGQTARLELKNTSDQPVAVRLQFVDKAGKILAQKEIIIPAKDRESEPSITGPNNPLLEFPFVGGPGPNFGLLAQIQYPADWLDLLPNSSHSKKPIDLLQPSLRILESSSGNPVRLIGPHGFKGLNVAPGTRCQGRS